MKKLMPIMTGVLLAAAISTPAAADVYSGFTGNSDLYRGLDRSDEMSAAQPGVGDSFDRYHGWGDGNPDLFSDEAVTQAPRRYSSPDVYRGFTGNPDL